MDKSDAALLELFSKYLQEKLSEAADAYGMGDIVSFSVTERYIQPWQLRMGFGDIYMYGCRIPYMYVTFDVYIEERPGRQAEFITVNGQQYNPYFEIGNISQEDRKDSEEKYYLHPHVSSPDSSFCGNWGPARQALSDRDWHALFHHLFFMMNSHNPDSQFHSLPIFYECIITGEADAELTIPASDAGGYADLAVGLPQIAFSESVAATCYECGMKYPISLLVDEHDAFPQKKHSDDRFDFQLTCRKCIRNMASCYEICSQCGMPQRHTYSYDVKKKDGELTEASVCQRCTSNLTKCSVCNIYHEDNVYRHFFGSTWAACDECWNANITSVELTLANHIAVVIEASDLPQSRGIESLAV